MTDEEARRFIKDGWGTPALHRLEIFVDAVVQENTRQNLIAANTIPAIWSRHIVDSAQLLALADADGTHWVDVGTGAGFPGMVVAVLRQGDVTLIEPRARRVAFLRAVAARLGLAHVHVVQAKAEGVAVPPATIVSARAVATIDAVFDMSRSFTDSSTTFILPRGRSGASEVETLPHRWHGMFHVEQSLTDPDAAILVATGVRRRCSASR